jgi:hypothetical protein
MNEWGHLEQRNEGQRKDERSDRIFRSPERAPAAGRTSGEDKTHITQGLNDREQVERTADRIRDELLLTLEELERRRGRALDVRYQASRHQNLIIGAAVAGAVLASIGLGVVIWRARHREQILARHRLKAVRRAWHHPDRVASSAEQRPLPVELGRKLIIIFASALASNIAKNSVQALVPRQRPAPAKV